MNCGGTGKHCEVTGGTGINWEGTRGDQLKIGHNWGVLGETGMISRHWEVLGSIWEGAGINWGGTGRHCGATGRHWEGLG